MTIARFGDPSAEPTPPLHLVRCIGPHQITIIGEVPEGVLVTVTYPVGSDTVLSVDEHMQWSTKPQGAAGPYECALQPYASPDRLVYAPKGRDGEAFLLPYTNAIPNV